MNWSIFKNNKTTALIKDPAIRYALVVFIATRLFLSLWAILILFIRPLPAEPDEVLRPYLGEPDLKEGVVGLTLGPWQRFDTMHYLRIARSGYAVVEDSVFPPLYPVAFKALGLVTGSWLPEGTRNMLAAVVISNVAFLGSLVLLYWIAADELDESAARRSVVYLSIFPTAFFLLAAYTESLFLLFAMITIWTARRGRFWQAGVAGLLAALTRLTGWILIFPLSYEYLRQRSFKLRRIDSNIVATLLPLVGVLGFLAYRWLVGLPSIDLIYRTYWYQTTGFPGFDLLTAVRQFAVGGAAFRLYFDLFCAGLLLVTTVIVFRRLGPTYGLYSSMLLLFMFLPTSELKPLFSFSRYTLAFFPTFMILGIAGLNPWINRLIVYPSIAFYLYFSGQFIMWGWVA